MKRFQSNETYILVESAIMIALSTVLSLIKVIQLPLGGAVTLLSMLPICLVSIRHGVKWGLGAGFSYSVIQLLLDGAIGWGLSPWMLIGCLLFDYLIAFTVLGLAGIFRKKGIGGVCAGIAAALGCRFLSHFLSGVIIFTKFEQWSLFGSAFENAPVLYSLCYNGFFMLPETALTILAVFLLSKVPTMRKLLLGETI